MRNLVRQVFCSIHRLQVPPSAAAYSAAADSPFNLEIFQFSPYQTNTYLLSNNDLTETVLIDCPYDSHRSLRSHPAIKSADRVHLFLTHGHSDHAGDLGLFRDNARHELTVYAHEDEFDLIDESVRMYSGVEAEIDVFIDDGDFLDFFDEEVRFEILHTPGHSPGSVSLHLPTAGIVFVGDVLFQGSIGRTDLPGGFFRTLENSIREKLYTLPDETIVFSGHGPKTSIGREKLTNYFVRDDSHY